MFRVQQEPMKIPRFLLPCLPFISDLDIVLAAMISPRAELSFLGSAVSWWRKGLTGCRIH